MLITDKRLCQRTSLSSLVRVQPGYLSRDRVRHVAGGTHHLLQGKDVSEAGGIRPEAAIRFHPERRAELYQISRGDVLFTARGQDHRACHVSQDLSDVLAAATFYILRPDPRRILPGYLAWWLNLPRTQSAIYKESGGTDIRYIRRQAVENLQVPVPALQVQQRIERVVSLWSKRKALQARIDDKREQLIQTVCRQAASVQEEA